MAGIPNEEHVLLGILDEEIATPTASFTVNKIGGLPDWINGKGGAHMYTCRECSRVQALVCQVYCPLDGSDQHRTLYVMACTNRTCWNKQSGWTILRCQATDPTYVTHSNSKHAAIESMTKDTVDDWGTGASDWGTGASDWGAGASDWGAGASDWGAGASDWGTDSTNETASLGRGEGMVTDWGQGADDWGDNTRRDSERIERHDGTLQTKNPPNNMQMNEHNALVSSQNAENQVLIEEITERTSGGTTVHDMSSTQLLDKLDGDIHSLLCDKDDTNDVVTECTSTNDSTGNSEELSADFENIDLKATSVINYLELGAHGQNNIKVGDSEAVLNSSPNLVNGNQDIHVLRSFYLNVFDEPICIEEKNYKHEQKLLREYAKTDSGAFETLMEDSKSRSKTSRKEGYEKADVKHGDKVFHSFTKRLARCPQQVLRYEHGGTAIPLRVLTRDDVIPACGNCGSPRMFELQLMPGLVSFLQFQQSQGVALEFGTVMVYICKKSCQSSEDTPIREHVLVQPDPDQHLFRT